MYGHEESQALHVEVLDTGSRLPQFAQDRLLEPFQASSAKGGVRLDMAIVSELVKGHVGKLTAQWNGATRTCF